MRSLNQLLSDWRQSEAAMKKLQDNTPRIVGNESVKAIKENFKLSGYDTGSGVTGWKERKESTNKSYDSRHGVKGSVFNSENPLLIQTHNLYNSIRYQAGPTVVNIGVDLGLIPYAKAINEGDDKTGMPARKYIPANNEPPNPKILKRILKKITFERDRAMGLFKK